jgi:hypothetical protein
MKPLDQILSELQELLEQNKHARLGLSGSNVIGYYLRECNLPWFLDIPPPIVSYGFNLQHLRRCHHKAFYKMEAAELEWAMFWCTFGTWYFHDFYRNSRSDINENFRWDLTADRRLFEHIYEGRV